MNNISENKTFDFATAVKYLQEGKKVRFVDWSDGEYLYFSVSEYSSVLFHEPSGLEYYANPSFVYSVQWELYND